MSWTSLPQELQLQIVELLDREDCKSLRTTRKSSALVTSSKLFRTIHLTPNTRSFDRARNIVRLPHLAQHVKHVVYHLGVLEDVHSGFQTFREDIMRIHKPIGSTSEITEDILWKYNCFLEEMDGQRDFETRDEADELKAVCSDLTNLATITTVLDEDDPFSPPQDFIGRRTGVQSACSAEGHHFSNLFNATAGKTLTGIHGYSMSWRCLSRVVDGKLSEVNLQKLSELSIGLFNSEFLDLEEDDQTVALESLDAFLLACISPELHSLRIDFDEIPYQSMSLELCYISEVVFKHHWSNLVSLALQGIAATEDDIVRFLTRHKASLKALHLDDIEVVDEITYDVDGNTTMIPGSVLSLFRQINENLTLDSASLSGVFTNRMDESWYVDLECDLDHCLRRDIELWLSHRGPSPFPEDLIINKRQKEPKVRNIQTVIALNDQIILPQSRGLPFKAAEFVDESWVWDPELYEEQSDSESVISV